MITFLTEIGGHRRVRDERLLVKAMRADAGASHGWFPLRILPASWFSLLPPSRQQLCKATKTLLRQIRRAEKQMHLRLLPNGVPVS